MISEAIFDRLDEWLCPNLVKQRDMALEKVHDLSQSLDSATSEVLRLTVECRRLERLVEAAKNYSPVEPKILRPATAAEVRRLMERESLKGESDGV